MKKNTPLLIFGLIAAACLLPLLHGHAWAQSSLGIGVNEATLPSSGYFSGFLNWINTQQQTFYRALTGALRAMREDQSQMWILVGLSFLYGAFHAAGPGHGKVVISLYVAANDVALRRGVMLSFVSAFLQAISAIILISLVFLVLRGTSITMTNATRFLEITSYALIATFGAWLLWRKARGIAGSLSAQRHVKTPAAPHQSSPAHGHDHHCDHDHHGHQHEAVHAAGETCPDCGYSHMPDPSTLGGDRFDWKAAGAAVAAVGARPCSGALIVLTFAFLNNLWLGGILSVFAMAFGTALTVASLAILAVTGRSVAMRVASGGRTGILVHHAFEICGATFIMIIGLLLLAASL